MLDRPTSDVREIGFVIQYQSYVQALYCIVLYCIVLYCIVLYCIVLYCIVLYLHIYIALLEVHTNQKRFQCERPSEKRAVLKERKEALNWLTS